MAERDWNIFVDEMNGRMAAPVGDTRRRVAHEALGEDVAVVEEAPDRERDPQVVHDRRPPVQRRAPQGDGRATRQRVVDGLAATRRVIAFDIRGVGASTGAPASTPESTSRRWPTSMSDSGTSGGEVPFTRVALTNGETFDRYCTEGPGSDPEVGRQASSYLARRVLATLQQGSGDKPASDPIGGDAKIVVLSGHDGTVTMLAGLLGLEWQVPGYAAGQAAPAQTKPAPQAKGKLISLATETDRTLFFDFMPLELGTVRGFKTRFHLYTVPGQVYYDASRKLILKGVDGVVFVADSQEERMDANIESLYNLEENLQSQGYDLMKIPFMFISSCCGFGENFSASPLLIFPAFQSR